jgi:hypothetical protein
MIRAAIKVLAMLLAAAGNAPATPRQALSSGPSPLSLPDLAGTYVETNGRYGTVLTLYRSGRFRFSTSRDNLDVPEKRSRGTVRIEKGVLLLKSALPMRVDEEWERLPTRLVPILWGKRRYLVRHGDRFILAFCNNINLGYEPRTSIIGVPYLRQGGEKIRVTGPPAMPGQWRDYLLQKPVTCRVTQVTGDIAGEVDVGAEGGLKPGMLLVSRDGRRLFRVKKVETGSASIEAEINLSRPVSAGEQLSTRALR